LKLGEDYTLSTALQLFQSTKQQLQDWSWFKRALMVFTIITFLVSSFLFLTGPGTDIRIWMANSVIITQHREWAWIFVGTELRDSMVKKMHQFIEENAEEKQQFNMIKHQQPQEVAATRKNRTIDQLIKVEDISGTFWKGKRMYVYDPKTIRLMTPAKSGEGEKISSMVTRTGAVAGVNAGGFDDPEGLGNGFAAIGAIISGGEVIYTDQESDTPQHIVGFTKDGTLVIGKYNMFELQEMGISEAASFYPRVIANGKPLPINDVSRAPRTAVAQKADGTVIFIIADGRSTSSVGATLKEIQELFLAEDVVNAGFLDGGASSQLVVDGVLVTKPSSRYGERRLPSAYLVYDHPEEAVANRVWDGITKINAGGAFDHPDFLKEQAALKAKGITTPSTSKPVEPVKPTAPTNSGANGAGATTPAGNAESTNTKQNGVESKGTNDNKTPTAPTQSTTPNPAKEPVKPSANTTDKPQDNHSTVTNPAGNANPVPNPAPTNDVTTPGAQTVNPGATAPVNGSTTTPNTGVNPVTGDSGANPLPATGDSTATKNITPAPAAAPTASDAAVKSTAPASTPAAATPAATVPVATPGDSATKATTPASAPADTSVKSAPPASSPTSIPPTVPPSTGATTTPAVPVAPTAPTTPAKVN
jgi:exopolysaccharide biosynthesis protein